MDIKGLFGIDKIKISRDKLPQHVAVSIKGCPLYAKKNKKTTEEVSDMKFLNIRNIAKICVKLEIPITTFYILPSVEQKEEEEVEPLIDSLAGFFEQLNNWDFINENQVKVSVLGKWYDLPSRVIEPIKQIIDSTKDYDKYFLNLCINYNGQDEIVDAVKLIGRQIESGKLSPESIDKTVIKENLYTSYFLPPRLIIRTGSEKKLDGFLLWDSPKSRIYFADTLWPDFGKKEFLKAIEQYQKES